MALTRSPAWLTSFCSTNSVDWRSGAVMETQTWERPMTWASGKHGSKPVQEMIRPRLWSLPIFGNGPVASSVVTGTCRLTRFISHGADVIIALLLGLAACFLREASFCDRACISAPAVHHYR